jgi:hypothetical protein
MHLLFTEGAKDLDIHLVLWWIPSAIQVVPFNRNLRDQTLGSTDVAGYNQAPHRPEVHPEETEGKVASLVWRYTVLICLWRAGNILHILHILHIFHIL